MSAVRTIRGRFELVELAGRGGMGEVWRAVDRETGEALAIKLLRGEVGTDLHARRFAREADTLASLSHPGIVGYRGHGVDETGALFLAMEWLEGETLAERLRREQPTVAEVLRVARAVADALAHAHAHRVIHRDVKPSNVLLVDRRLDRARLIDFGIARERGPEARMTETGAVLGTPEYMAPEQARGRAIDARADVYSLGCVLYEALAGAPPFVGETVIAVLAKTLLDEAVPLAERAPEVPPPLARLVDRMLSKSADERPRDAAEVAAALAAIPDVDARPSMLPREPAARILTATEQRVFAVIAGAGNRDTRVEDPGGAPRETPLDRMPSIVREHGGSLEVLATGAIVAGFAGGQSPSELAERAVRCALAMRRLDARQVLAVALGHAVADGGGPRVGEAIDRVTAMVERWRAGAGDAFDEIPLAVDESIASLVEGRFQVVTTAAGERLVTRESDDETSRAILGRATPTVGRDREIASLHALFEECASEPVARVAVIEADAGLGKSRLMREVLARVAARPGTTVLFGRGDQLAEDAPFGVLAGMLRRIFDLDAEGPAAAHVAKMRAVVGEHLGDAASRERVVAFLAELVGLGLARESHPLLAGARDDPALSGDLMRGAFEEWLGARSASGPVVIALDDLQWADRPSVAFVDGVLRNLAERPIFVIASGRPEVEARFGPPFAERAPLVTRLAPLTRGTARKLLASALGEERAPSFDRLIALGEGNPFFLEELARALATGSGGALPETVIGLVQARLDRLAPGARRVLRAASVYGATFVASALPPLLGARESDDLESTLRELERDEILVRAAAAPTAEPHLSFRSQLVCDAAYATLTERDRAAAHGAAARWLAARGLASPGVLAEHLARAGDRAGAAEQLARVAERALEGNDFAGAIAAAERALAHAASPSGRLHLVRAEAHRWKGEYARAVEAALAACAALDEGSTEWFHAQGEIVLSSGYLGAHDRIEDVVRAVVLARAGHEARNAQVVCLCRAGWQLVQGGRYRATDAVLVRVEALAAEGPLAPAAEAWRAWLRSTRAQHSGDHRGYVDGRERARACFLEAGDERNAATVGMSLGYAHQLVGRYDRAEELLREALRAAERLGIAMSACYALHNLGHVLAKRGQLVDAIATESRAVEMATALRHARLEGASRLYVAQMRIEAGQAREAELEARRARELLAASKPLLPLVDATLGRALLAQGQDEGAAIVEQALATLESMEGTDEGESEVRLAHAHALLATRREPELVAALSLARSRILARAAKIADDETRATFLHDVPENRALLELAARWCDR